MEDQEGGKKKRKRLRRPEGVDDDESVISDATSLVSYDDQKRTGAGNVSRSKTVVSSTASSSVGTPRSASTTPSRMQGSARNQSRAKATFRAEIGSALVVTNTLKGISTGKKDQHAHCEIDAGGIKFSSTDPSLASQGCVSFLERLFEVWYLAPGVESVSFRINLSVLIHCLGCLGSTHAQATALKMSFFESEECFSIQLMEGSVLTECKIRTIDDLDMDDEEDSDGDEGGVIRRSSKLDFAASFRASPVANKGIVKSDQLRDAFGELADLSGAATIKILMSPERPFFRLSTQGQAASCVIDFPHGDESFAQLTCKQRLEFEYRLSLIQQAGKALQFSDKTFIRMNQDGTLSIQHMIQQHDGQKTYVDYYILADVGADDDDDDEADDDHEKSNRIIFAKNSNQSESEDEDEDNYEDEEMML